MHDRRVSVELMDRLGYGPTYTLSQMIVGAILTELDDGYGLGLVEVPRELGTELEACARDAMAGDGVVTP